MPTRLSQQFVEWVVGFGVSAAVGLAPYLGKTHIAGFSSLLSLFPVDVQDKAIPLASCVMGLVAIVIQWYGDRRCSSRWLREMFTRVLITALTSFSLLLVLYQFVVVSVPTQFGQSSVRYVVGFKRPADPPCSPPLIKTAADCIAKKLTLNPRKVESYFGATQVNVGTLCLLLPYLTFMGSFGLLVGLALLQNRNKRRA
jgi:hypothetical protein